MNSVSWYLVQYMPDRRRQETRNTGILIRTDERSLCRFLPGCPPGLNSEVYRSWVDYFDRKIMVNAWGDIERAEHRRRGELFTQLGGHILECTEPLEQLADRLFAEIVAPAGQETVWRIQVDIPLDQADRHGNALFDAVTNAVAEWEPTQRDGWDVDVSAGPAT